MSNNNKRYREDLAYYPFSEGFTEGPCDANAQEEPYAYAEPINVSALIHETLKTIQKISDESAKAHADLVEVIKKKEDREAARDAIMLSLVDALTGKSQAPGNSSGST